MSNPERVVPEPDYSPMGIFGRAANIARVVDFRHLFTTEADVIKARKTVETSLNKSEIDHAQWLIEGATHFTTGEVLPWWGRLAAWPYFSGVPMATIVLQVKYRGFNVPRLAFLHWCNQSVVASVNYYNGSKSKKAELPAAQPQEVQSVQKQTIKSSTWNPLFNSPMLAAFTGGASEMDDGLQKLLKAYSMACTSAVGIVLGTALTFKAVPALAPFAQYSGFAAAGTANVTNTYFMKTETLEQGIPVYDEMGETVGVSHIAANRAVRDTAITRIGLPFLSLFVAPAILNAVQAATPIAKFPRVMFAANFLIPFSMFPLGLPFTIGCLPEEMGISPADATDIHEDLAQKYGADWKSKDISLYYNRGR